MPSQEELQRQSKAMDSIKTLRRYAEGHEKAEFPHFHARNELHLSMQRQARMMEQKESVQQLRPAGMASINPRMGTCGSLPDLRELSGKRGLNHWRTATPWSLDHSLSA